MDHAETTTSDDDQQIWVFDPHTVYAEVIDDEDGLPVLAIGDGTHRLELPAGRDDNEAVAAGRRITEQIWAYTHAVAARRRHVDAPRGYVPANSIPDWGGA